jgi:hypothetical protein
MKEKESWNINSDESFGTIFRILSAFNKSNQKLCIYFSLFQGSIKICVHVQKVVI